MRAMVRTAFPLALAMLAAPALAAGEGGKPLRRIDFNREIRPVLSDKCFHCHGPDPKSREAGLRLDTQQGAQADLGGYRAVVPGQPDKSELYVRITAKDPDDRMPPAESHKTLTADEIALIKGWIQQGANWQPHWAFIPVAKRGGPTAPNAFRAWARNPIDHFVAAKLEEAGLAPAPEAPREVLVRRATLDLTGLPPSPAEVEAFVADRRPDAYERLVDRLLASPRYGEHQARIWLDAARYGDTHGLHFDNKRAIWPYRDWVVRALNANLPYDKFTLWQLAGDLLPKPSREQVVATGFLRCNMTTNEGGVIPDEAKVHLVRDRVEAFSTIWLGLTAGCAACHDHKYDPFSQKDFYQLSAYFDNGVDEPLDGNIDAPRPFLLLATPEQEKELKRLDEEITAADRKIREALDRVEYEDPLTPEALKKLVPSEIVWVGRTLPEGAKLVADGASFERVDDGLAVSAEASGRVAVEGAPTPLEVGAKDELFAHVWLDPKNPPRAVMIEWSDGESFEHRAWWGEPLIGFGKRDEGGKDGGKAGYKRMGALPRKKTGARWVRLAVPAEAVGLKPGAKVAAVAFAQYGGRARWDRAGLRTLVPQAAAGESYASLLLWEKVERAKGRAGGSAPDAIKRILEKETRKRSEAEKRQLRDHFFAHVWGRGETVFRPLHDKREPLARQRQALDESIPRTLVYEERSERAPTHLLVRGEYDRKGDAVAPGTPSVLPPPRTPARDRLALAKWLLDRDNPLTARVTVNRLWQQHFGVGLVKTAWDFGAQGELPSHADLLDWLARSFVDGGWNLKALHRLMVTSAAYRQVGAVSKPKLEKDPENRLLSRGPRFRLDAEVIRDAALAVSGLLVERRGGAGVKPYEPGDLWVEVAYPGSNTKSFKADRGEALYRRSLYTFWKRTSPPPAMIAFDAPTREYCTVRRERTNTPLQALVLMNDPQFVEAARKLAERMMREGGETPEQRIAFAFRLVTGRRADADDVRTLKDLFVQRYAHYRVDQAAARRLLAVGDALADEQLPASELAAWTSVASALLNLDEFVNN